MASCKSKGLSMHVTAVRGVLSPTSAKYFVNIFAPYPQPIPIKVVHGLALLMNCIAVQISSLSAAVNNLHNVVKQPYYQVIFGKNYSTRTQKDLLSPIAQV